MPKLMWIPMVVVVVGCFAAPDSAAQPLAIKADDAALQWGGCPPIFPAGCQITVLTALPTSLMPTSSCAFPAATKFPLTGTRRRSG